MCNCGRAGGAMLCAGLCIGIVFSLYVVPAASSGSYPKTYDALCPDGAAVQVDGSQVGSNSTYRTYRRLVCRACAVKTAQCVDLYLFKGNTRRLDRDGVSPHDLHGLALKPYKSEEREVSYRCPDTDVVQTARCKADRTYKDCLVRLCKQCRSSECEAYREVTEAKCVNTGEIRPVHCLANQTLKACLVKSCEWCASAACVLNRGHSKVSTLEVTTVSRDIYKVKIANSAKDNNATAKPDGAKGKDVSKQNGVKTFAVIGDKEALAKATAAIGVPQDKIASVDRILKLGTDFYAQDVDGGLMALVELVGHPLTQEDKLLIESHLSTAEEANYTTDMILELLMKEWARAQSACGPHPDGESWRKWHGQLIACTALASTVVGCLCCMHCCLFCLRRKQKRRCVLHRYKFSKNLSQVTSVATTRV